MLLEFRKCSELFANIELTVIHLGNKGQCKIIWPNLLLERRFMAFFQHRFSLVQKSLSPPLIGWGDGVNQHIMKKQEKLWLRLEESEVGCPRNNQICFRFEPKQTETQSVSVVFRFVSRNQKTFFSVCRKISKKRFILGGPRNSYFLFFSVRTETNRKSICFGCFSVCFMQNQIIFSSVCFGVSDRYRNNRNKGMGN